MRLIRPADANGSRRSSPNSSLMDTRYPSAMRLLVTGGAGFIGSHFVKRLVAAGDEVVVLDKLTYAGNPANLEGTGVDLVEGDIADPETVARAAVGCEAIVNFAAETHVDRSILDLTRPRRHEHHRRPGAPRVGA